MYEVAKPLKIEAAKVAEIPEAAQIAKGAAENYFLFKELILCHKLKFSMPPDG